MQFSSNLSRKGIARQVAEKIAQCNRALTVFSYRWGVVYLFSEEFRVHDIATILHVGCTFFKLKKLIKLYRETSTVNYPANARRRSKTRHLDGMYILCTLLISFEISGKLTNKIRAVSIDHASHFMSS